MCCSVKRGFQDSPDEDFLTLPKLLQPRVYSVDKIVLKILLPGFYIIVPVVLDVLFQHTTLQPHWDSWHSFFQVQCLRRADLLFSFSGLDIQPQNVKPAFVCFVLRWWTRRKIASEMLSSRMGCSYFAHALLTLCSRFAHALLMLCSRFGGWCVYLDEESHKQTMPLFCCSKPCVPKAHSFQAADSLRLILKSEKNHMPLTTLRWSGVAAPLPQPEICMCIRTRRWRKFQK